MKLIIGNLIIFLLLLLALEGILRANGYSPYPMGTRPDIQVSPNGQYFQEDSLMGYKHLVGEFEITLKQVYQFRTQHDSSTLRVTSLHTDSSQLDRPEIWVFGCSFTYGWSINDDETFAWHLQSRLPDFRVVNWGVNGYGTIHFYLQLQEALKKQAPPQFVIINHAHFHHERNFFSYNHRLSVSRWNFLGRLNQPYVCLDRKEQMTIQHSEMEYSPWKLSHSSALVYFYQCLYESYSDSRMHYKSRAMTRMLFDEIVELCQANQIQVMFTNIGEPELFAEDYCLEKELPFVNLSLNLKNHAFTNEPYDRHPNARAHQIYANRLHDYLMRMLHPEF